MFFVLLWNRPKMYSRKYSFFILLAHFFNHGFAYQLQLVCDSPVVLGATINCTTTVYQNDGKTLADGTFKYYWRDNAIPQHDKLVESATPIDSWAVTYNRTTYIAGGYVIRVDVCRVRFFGLCNDYTSEGVFFYITDSLNGQLNLTQSNYTRDTYVSIAEPLKNFVDLKASDKNFIAKAPTVLSYWFVDCVYYGITSDFKFAHNFSQADENHVVESLVMADFTPPTTLAPPTTSTTAPTTTTTPTTHSTGTTPKIPTKTTAKTTPKPSKTKREAQSMPGTTIMVPVKNDSSNKTQSSNVKVWQNGTLVPYDVAFPYVCNSTVITTDSQKVYGYFKKSIVTKAPISNINVSGNNWLQPGELLSLNVNCKGSQQMQFCYFFKAGLYNVTGNETCRQYSDLDRCDFPISRYFQEDQHTVIIIIKNDVSHRVTSVAVTIYKANRQAQLSVIVVPVAFSLVAVVTIVFGVAYYLQNRSRFIVEVADFDFGLKYADMEYKTFGDRLKDSLAGAFSREGGSSTSDTAPIWPPGHKYGSMT